MTVRSWPGETQAPMMGGGGVLLCRALVQQESCAPGTSAAPLSR